MDGKRHQPDNILLFTVVILCAIGVITVYSASTYFAIDNGFPANHYAVRQAIAALLGLGIMIGLTHIRYHFWYRFAPALMVVNLVLLTAVLIPGVGVAELGGRRWLGHGSVTFQPSEFALLILAVYLAFFFSKQVMYSDRFARGLLPALMVAGLNFILIFLEPDMGTALTLLGMALIVALASGTRLKPLLIIIVCTTPVLLYAALSSHYRSSRITAFLHPFPQTASTYQLLQGWTAIADGGWFGRGFGNSIEKTGYLPVPHIDFIFPVFVSEWGIVGGAVLLIIFGVLIWRGFSIARHAADRFGAMLAVGMTSIITVGAFINLGAVTGLLPVTGIPLPFISYGGTSLVISLLAMGILLSVSRYTLDEVPEMDELADVIEVTEARARLGFARKERLSAAATSASRSAQVAPLRRYKGRTAKERAPTFGTWRNNEPLPGANGNKRKQAKRSSRPAADSRSRSQTASWSERVQDQPSWRGSASGRKTGSETRSSSGTRSGASARSEPGSNWRSRNQGDSRGDGRSTRKNSNSRKDR